jgi:uncharacterized protein (TIGR02145 family)
MGWTSANIHSNNLPGAGSLTYKIHISSSEYYNNTGQHTSTSESAKQNVLGIDEDGSGLAYVGKTSNADFVCAWRPPDLQLTPSVATICEGQSQSVILTATPAGAASYSINGTDWQTSNTFSVSPNVTTTYPLYMQAADGSQASVTVAAVVTVNTPPTAPTGLSANITGVCDGIATPATLTATGGSEGDGAVYEWGTGSVVGSNSFTATAGSTCSVAPDAATTYWVRRLGDGACSATTATTGATITIALYPAIEPGTITTASTNTTTTMDPPDIPIESEISATGGSGSVTYMWVRTGTSSATLTGSAATYNISDDVTNYINVGTFYFNRYAQDAACPGVAPVAEAGTYTLSVGAGLIVLCEECCWDGSAATWVNCYVPKIPYMGIGGWNNGSTHTWVLYGAQSDRDGRANTAVIPTDVPVSAVGWCKDRASYRYGSGGHAGWYLPAYEELVNMGDGTTNTPLNGRPGAGVLSTLPIPKWSSTEYRDNVTPDGIPGRYSYSGGNTAYNAVAVAVMSTGELRNYDKVDHWHVVCAWRPPDPLPGAASTQTWVFGSQTWSDRLMNATGNCASASTLSTAASPPAQYLVSGGRFYYNWVCVDAAKTTLCPDPWRVPSETDFNTLISTLGGNTQTARDAIMAAWGYGGVILSGSTGYGSTTDGHYWSSTDYDTAAALYMGYYSGSLYVTGHEKFDGMQVRCVR